MEIVESHAGEVLILEFRGRLDVNTSVAAQEQTLARVDQGARQVVADLAHLDYLSSAGLHVLMMVAKRLKSCGGRLVLCAPKDYIRDLFDIAGVGVLLPVVGSKDEALKLLH